VWGEFVLSLVRVLAGGGRGVVVVGGFFLGCVLLFFGGVLWWGFWGCGGLFGLFCWVVTLAFSGVIDAPKASSDWSDAHLPTFPNNPGYPYTLSFDKSTCFRSVPLIFPLTPVFEIFLPHLFFGLSG